MSEYTPTTEEVCEIYWQSGYKTTVEQFDRWLAQVKADVYDEALQDAGVSPMLRNHYRELTE